MNISERIFEILEEKKMSQSEFSRRTGISTSTINDWKHKNTNPSADKIMIICKVLDIFPEELLDQEHHFYGDFVSLTPDERKLLECYQVMDNKDQKRLRAYATRIMNERSED